MAIDPRVAMMANKMQAARGGAARPMQQPAQVEQPEQQDEKAIIDQLRALLTKALELLGPGV